jgi:hypothetical protein
MNLEDVVAEIKELEKILDTDIRLVQPAQVRAAQAARLRAEKRIETLRSEYERALVDNIVLIAAVGAEDKVDEFCYLASEEQVPITVNSTLYRGVAERCLNMVGRNGGKVSVDVFARMVEEVVEVARELEVVEMPELHYKSVKPSTVHSVDDMEEAVRNCVVAAMQNDLLKVYLKRRILSDLCLVGFAGTVAPVVVTGLTAEEVSNLHNFGSGKHFIVDLRKEFPTKNTVNKILKTIKFKKKKSEEIE